MKILYCITGLGIGGAEAITIDIANRMAAIHDVTLLYLTGENKQLERIHRRLKVIGIGMYRNPVSFVKAQRKVRQYISKWQPDIVHANMVHANLFCRVLRLHCKISLLVCTEHSKNIEGCLRMWMYRFTDCLSDVNTNVSEEATSFFIEQKSFSAHKSKTVYNGIDLGLFAPCRECGLSVRERYGIKKDDFLFLNVGRLMPAKDQRNLITAFHRLAGIYPNVKLLMVGDGELREELEQYVVSLLLANQVIFAGSQQQVVDYYNAANCFVLSSAWEGFGIVLAEAMACELPVIATDSGGCAEVVDEGEYLVKPRDSGALFLKMKQIYEMNQEERLKLGAYNREKAMRFDINRICEQWLEIYNKRN